MKRLALLPLLVFTAFCATSRDGGSQRPAAPGHGAISIAVVPNPIVARPVSGDTYDFPFDVVVRETGGRSVNVTRVSVDVTALGGIPVSSESYDAAQIKALGFPASLSPNGELHYHFAPRQSVPDDRLFSSVSARLRVDAVDDQGASTNASTAVTVRR